MVPPRRVRIFKVCVLDDSVHEKVNDNGGAEGVRGDFISALLQFFFAFFLAFLVIFLSLFFYTCGCTVFDMIACWTMRLSFSSMKCYLIMTMMMMLTHVHCESYCCCVALLRLCSRNVTLNPFPL